MSDDMGFMPFRINGEISINAKTNFLLQFNLFWRNLQEKNS